MARTVDLIQRSPSVHAGCRRFAGPTIYPGPPIAAWSPTTSEHEACARRPLLRHRRDDAGQQQVAAFQRRIEPLGQPTFGTPGGGAEAGQRQRDSDHRMAQRDRTVGQAPAPREQRAMPPASIAGASDAGHNWRSAAGSARRCWAHSPPAASPPRCGSTSSPRNRHRAT
jgi:hypothetical protein